ncbi:2'-5' RNA ligase family protein [Streptomyces sp. NPDC045369]|uniref:2'-5' RNA ligase family protein n=1 Tax=Streptomyces sp. NPDC045369 TaxID=3155732 RepID=UPI0033E3B58F
MNTEAEAQAQAQTEAEAEAEARREPPAQAQVNTPAAADADPSGSEPAATGWPDIPGDTALTIKVPEADPLVRTGFPAHVTVLYPFVHESRIDATTRHDLTRLFAGHDAFTLTFDSFGRYPGVLCLDPWPHDPVTALTKDLTRRWPEAVPYRGIFGAGLAPHLTIANHEGPATQEAAYGALQAELAPALPLSCSVRAVQLIVWDGRRWQDRAEYRLGAPYRAA